LYWLEVSLPVDEAGAEVVSEILRPFAQDNSIVLEQLGDARDLDPNALEPGVTVKIYIPGDEDSARLRRRIIESLAQVDFPPPTFHKLEETDWANAWKEHYQPFRVGKRLWIQPGWLEATENRPEDVVLTLDPGMAFGTGTHQTTQLCLEALEEFISGGDKVLDVGTGSGILAIAAVKLGAGEVMALDTDRQAVKAVIENAELNQTASKITTRQGTLASLSPKKKYWDLVLVNIQAPVIIDLFNDDDLLGYLSDNGRLILSGIVDIQAGEVEAAVVSAGGQLLERRAKGEWIGLVVGRAI
jgi:ribosomal protein L11 methyltransferase